MKPLPHVYEVRLAGGPTGYVTASGSNLPDLCTAPPRDFDGPGDAWSPEQLLVAAVETCFLFTLRAVAAASKVEFTSLQLSGQETLEHTGGVTRFTKICLNPFLRLPPEWIRVRSSRYSARAPRSASSRRHLVHPFG